MSLIDANKNIRIINKKFGKKQKNQETVFFRMDIFRTLLKNKATKVNIDKGYKTHPSRMEISEY